MHLHRILFLPYLFVAGAGALTIANLEAALFLTPQCAVGCITSSLSTVPTFLSNPSMICANITLQATLSACIQAVCTYTEQAEVGILDAELCAGHPIQSRSTMVAVFGLVCGPITLLAVALRCYSRLLISKRLSCDDWLIVVGAAVLAVVTLLGIYNSWGNGFGRHYWNVNSLRVTQLLKLRVFSSTWFRAADIVVLIVTVSSGIGMIFAVIAQCTPISGAWDKTIESRCIDVNALAFASGGISVGLDVIILILPMPEFLGLRMSLRKKMNLLVMFSLGSFACITSIVRISYLVDFAKSTDPTYDNALAVVWTFLEVCVGVICACLPAIRAIFSRWLPKLFDKDFDLRKTHNDPDLNSSAHLSRPIEKVGPSYNKYFPPMLSDSDIKSVSSPLAEAFNLPPAPSRETKIRINPKFDESGQLVDFHYSEPSISQSERQSSVLTESESTSTSLWVLDGPRSSREHGPDLDVVEQGVAMRKFLTVPGKANVKHVEKNTREE